MAQFSDEYLALLDRGPFDGRIDPWAEKSDYFRQLHSQMIGDLLANLSQPLKRKGYIIGRERSLQIAEGRQPDLHIHQMPADQQEIDAANWNYAQAAEIVQAEPGTLVEVAELELEALYISDMESGELITVVELISPTNKVSFQEIENYQERRKRLLKQQVHIVEIDLTRSVKRLLHDTLVNLYPYHIAVFLHDQASRLIVIELDEPLKRIALPLKQDAIAIDLQETYSRVYQQTSTATLIWDDSQYSEDALPFPSLLSEQRRHDLQAKVAIWRDELAKLRDG